MWYIYIDRYSYRLLIVEIWLLLIWVWWWIASTRGSLRGVVGVTCGRKRLKRRYSYRYRYRYRYSKSKNKRKKDTIRNRNIINHICLNIYITIYYIARYYTLCIYICNWVYCIYIVIYLCVLLLWLDFTLSVLKYILLCCCCCFILFCSLWLQSINNINANNTWYKL